MDDTTTRLGMYLVIFWTLLLILGGIFGKVLTLDDDEVYSPLDNDDRGNLIWSVLTFQITDQVPVILSIFLGVLVIFSVYVIYMVLHPTK